jgi:N-methylhydantoinase A
MFHVINVNMAAAIREISVQKGYDPREFPLICAGGAGPIHGAYIALELGIARVCVPRESSIFCASGMLRSNLKHDYVRSFARVLAPGGAQRARLHAGVLALVREMQTEARAALKAERIPRTRQRLRYGMDLRYLGQYHEVTIDVPERLLARSDWARVAELFHARHDHLYGYALRDEGAPVELLNLRLTAIGVTDKPALKRQPRVGPGCAAAIKGRRPAYLPEHRGFRDVPVYDGDLLVHGNRLYGPAIIESVNTSILVPSGFVADYDMLGSCVLTLARPKRG